MFSILVLFTTNSAFADHAIIEIVYINLRGETVRMSSESVITLYHRGYIVDCKYYYPHPEQGIRYIGCAIGPIPSHEPPPIDETPICDDSLSMPILCRTNNNLISFIS